MDVTNVKSGRMGVEGAGWCPSAGRDEAWIRKITNRSHFDGAEEEEEEEEEMIATGAKSLLKGAYWLGRHPRPRWAGAFGGGAFLSGNWKLEIGNWKYKTPVLSGNRQSSIVNLAKPG